MKTKVFKFLVGKSESYELAFDRFFKSMDSVDILTIKQVVVRDTVITTVFYIESK